MVKLNGSEAPTRWGRFLRVLQYTYLADWIGLCLMIFLLIISQHLTPYHQQILLSDYRIQHPHALHERVPFSMLIFLGAIVPLIVCLFALALSRSPHRIHVGLLGLGLALTTTDFLTNLAKNAIGRPRPDLLARCKPKPFQPFDKWLDISVCTEPDQGLLQDGWRSFPSGHSSFTFAGMAYLAFLLAGQMRVMRPNANFLKGLAVLAPFVVATGVAVSRLEDYRHDPYDVTAGSLLGLAVAYVSYRRYFPALRDVRCHEAYSALATDDVRGGGGGGVVVGYGRVVDEEAQVSRPQSYELHNDRDDDEDEDAEVIQPLEGSPR